MDDKEVNIHEVPINLREKKHLYSKDCPNVVFKLFAPTCWPGLLFLATGHNVCSDKVSMGMRRGEENMSSLGAQESVSVDLISKWLTSPF